MFRLIGKYIRALKKAIHAKDELIEAQDQLIHNLKRENFLHKRIKQLDRGEVKLWIRPNKVNTLVLHKQSTIDFLRSLRNKLNGERVTMNDVDRCILSPYREGKCIECRNNMARLLNTPGIVR